MTDTTNQTDASRTESDKHWERVDRGRDIARRMQAEEKQTDIISDVLPELTPKQQRILAERIDDGVQDAVTEYLEEIDR